MRTILTKIKNLKQRNINLGKIKIFYILLIFSSLINPNYADDKKLEGKFIQLKILDKVSSKNTTFQIEIGQEEKFQNLLIKVMKCKNSEFDDNPEVTAYIQVKDVTQKNNDKVFVFNGWTFSSSPSLQPFDHPVYDIWLTKCYN